MLQVLHFVGSFPLAIGFLSQIIVLLASLKDKDKKAILQSVLLMTSLGLIMVSVLMRPKSPPNLIADIIGCVGAAFLLTPGVEALLKLRGSDQAQDGKEAKN